MTAATLGERSPMDPTLAVVVARLDDLRTQQRADTQALAASISALQAAIESQRRDTVSRGEWEQRNSHVDRRFDDQGREIGDLRKVIAVEIAEIKTDASSRRIPWTNTVSAIGVIVALALSLVTLLTR